MKFSYNWLSEFLPDLALSAEALAEVLTMGLFETQVVARIDIDPLTIVAKIVELQPHPNADRLQLATIDTGTTQVTVVCGAPNIAVGQLVPYSPPGTTVQSEDGSSFILNTVTIRGVESPGMLNSPRELGLSHEHGGIYVLPAGTALASSLALHIPTDVILEVELTPNRAHDCYSHRGLAREIGALLDIKVVELEIPTRADPILPKWTLAVPAADHDTRAYYGTLLTNVRVEPSPLWLQARLWSVGVRPINSVVDVTNLVLFELGNPLHAYDADTLPGTDLNVRKGRVDESFTTLDEKQHDLTTASLIITSNNEPVALAGVMGGQVTQVTSGSTNVLIEAANFYPYTIYRSATEHNIWSESARRWVKDVPITLTKEALDRAIQLLVEVAGVTIVGQVKPVLAAMEIPVILFNPNRPAVMAGIPITSEVVQRMLVRQRCLVDASDSSLWRVSPPADRIDLVGEHDLVEDVLRLVGYNHIPAAIPKADNSGTIPALVQWREIIRDLLCVRGFTEVQNYSFANARIPVVDAAIKDSATLLVQNPVAPELQELRHDVLASVLGSVLVNRSELKHQGARAERGLFEVGVSFHQGIGGKVDGVIEREQLVGVLVGDSGTRQQAEAIALKIISLTGSDRAAIMAVEEALPSSVIRTKARMALAWFVIDFDVLIATTKLLPSYTPELQAKTVRYEPFSLYPAVYRDVSLLVASTCTVEQVREVIVRAGGSLVVSVELFDEYTPDSKDKSLGFRIAYQASDRTLTAAEVAVVHDMIVQQLRSNFQAQIKD